MRRVEPEVLKEGRREMAKIAREARDVIREEVPRGPAAGGHTFRAVTSGTRGLNPTLKLNRNYRPYTGGMFFGAKGDRYPQFPRARPETGGYYFYPTIKKIRPKVTEEWRKALDRAIRKAGLD